MIISRKHKENVREYFNNVSGEYGRAYDIDSADSLKTYIFLSRRENVINMVKKQRGRLLDIGCGPAVFTEKLLDKGYDEIWGIDISEAMIDSANKRMAEEAKSGKLHFALGDIEKLNFSDNYFDYVLCIGVLEYLNDNSLALKEIHRVLKPNGEVIFTVPNLASPFSLIDKFLVMVIKASLRLLTAVGIRVNLSQKRLLFRNDIKDRYYLPFKFNGQLLKKGFKIDKGVFHIYRLSALNAISRRLSLFFTRRLEWLSRTPFYWTGINYIVKAHKE